MFQLDNTQLYETILYFAVFICFSLGWNLQAFGELLQTEGAPSRGLPSQTKGEKTLVIFVSTLSGDTVSMLTHT